MAGTDTSTEPQADPPVSSSAIARIPAWIWPVLLVVGTAVHRAYAAAHTFWLSHDPGTVALMALHIAEGVERPMFLYGFPYSGALLAYYTAGLFGLFGVSTAILLAAPISLAAGWCAATYLLFRELLGRRAGLAAALCVAVPGWITTWYSMAPDCSYSPMFVLGVTILWLCVRITRRAPTGGALWAHVLPLGLLAGLALWTHPLTAVYLLAGGVILLPFFIRRRAAPRTLLPFLVGGGLFVLALLPYRFAPSSTSSNLLASFHLEPSVLWLNLKMLMKINLPHLLDWPASTGLFAVVWVRAIPAAVLLLYILALDGRASWGERWRYLFPVLFAGVFLVFYLPHSLAVSGVPRYALPLWTLLLGGMFAATISSSRRWVPWVSLALLVLWSGFQAVSLIRVAVTKQPKRDLATAHLDRLVQRTRDLGFDGVTVVGDYMFANRSVSYNFVARDEIRFAAADAERYQPAADAVDGALHPAIAITNAPLPALKATLDAMGVTYRVDEDNYIPLVHDFALDGRHRRSVPPGEMRARVWNVLMGAGDKLLDRRRSSLVSGRLDDGGGVLLDLGRARMMSGFYVGQLSRSGRGHPSGYRLEGSLDGEHFTILRDVPEGFPLVSTAGPRVLVGAGYARLEVRFSPTELRYLRFIPRSIYEGNQIWRFTEVYALEDFGAVSPPAWDVDADRVLQHLTEEAVRFTAADRWLSARIRNAFPSLPAAPAYPRYNPHYQVMDVEPGPGMGKRFVHPGPGIAVAVEAALADEAEQLLRTVAGENPTGIRRQDAGTYTVFTFERALPVPEPGLWWDGFTVLQE